MGQDGLFLVCFFYDLGKNKYLFGKNLGKTWEKLGTFGNGFQRVTKIFGKFLGITWE